MPALRNEKGHLLPGQAPLNPSGRPPVDPQLRAETHAVLTAATPKAARRLVELMDHRDARIALTAAETVLSRVYGKPLQQVDAKVETTNVQQAHLQILLELAGKRERAMREVQAIELAPQCEAGVAEGGGQTPAARPAEAVDGGQQPGASEEHSEPTPPAGPL